MTTPDLFDCVQAPAPRYLLRLAVLRRLFTQYLQGAGKRFLEIGPGMGDVSLFLSRHPAMGGGVVIDLAEKAVNITRARLDGVSGVDVRRSDLGGLGIESFDYVFSFEVLEHITEDLAFMREVHRHVNPGGLWFISVPAYMHKWQAQDEASGHVRRYEVDEMVGKLGRAGFDVLELVDYAFPLASLMRPARELFYRRKEGPATQAEALTLESGTERRLFGPGNTRLLLGLLWPFRVLQRLFSRFHLGDGLIVVARRHA